MNEPLERKEVNSRSLRWRMILSFVVFICLILAAWTSYKWIRRQPDAQGMPAPLRKVSQANEKAFQSAFDTGTLAKEYSVKDAVKKVRVNGNVGLSGGIDTSQWRLKLVKGSGDTTYVSLDDIKRLPKKDIVFDFKCIEGWSQVTHWAGVPVKTFMEAYGLKSQEAMKYIGLVTPDKQYYVGIDMPSALQEQTILCYEMNGAALPLNQGYPLRLIIPVKYGIKHLKRIGMMFFSDNKPADYWAERGYDYYSGH